MSCLPFLWLKGSMTWHVGGLKVEPGWKCWGRRQPWRLPQPLEPSPGWKSSGILKPKLTNLSHSEQISGTMCEDGSRVILSTNTITLYSVVLNWRLCRQGELVISLILLKVCVLILPRTPWPRIYYLVKQIISFQVILRCIELCIIAKFTWIWFSCWSRRTPCVFY